MHKLLFFLLLFPNLLIAQTICTLESRQKLDGYLEKASLLEKEKHSPIELNIIIGSWMLGTPYVEKTLEIPGDEKLVINLVGLDCTTYLETVIGLSSIVKKGQITFESYEKELEKIRYRNGILGEYPSRLHYFSDWLYENEQKGIIKDITAEIGGQTYTNQPSFMSENPQYYPQLSSPIFVNDIKSIETQIANRTYHYIPKSDIKKHESNIKSGDLIAITSSLNNLDIVHVGFAIEKAGRIHLLHASTRSMQVEITAVPLADYIQNNKSQTGIMVARMLD
ncbi:N-acetylmuramoyl-L-alanine amidase-like domain-containing protein [Belliella buryatensis]|nr:N-acetylmuramoyl-L-alanine amidase-like domain-containing protein [Belliella buryatensis]